MTTTEKMQALQAEFNARLEAIMQEETTVSSKATEGKKSTSTSKGKGKGGSAAKKGSKKGSKKGEEKKGKEAKEAKKTSATEAKEVDLLQKEIDEAIKENLPRLQKAGRKVLLAEVAGWWDHNPTIQKQQVELYETLSTEEMRQQILFDWGLEGGIAHFDIKEDETSQQEETSPKEEKKQQTKESKASSPKKKEDKEEKAEKEDKAKKKDKVEDKPGKAYDEFYHSGNDKKPRKDNILVAWWNSKTEDHSLGGKNERGTYIPVKGMKHNSKDWNVALGMARACAEMLSVQKPPKKGFDRVAVIK